MLRSRYFIRVMILLLSCALLKAQTNKAAPSSTVKKKTTAPAAGANKKSTAKAAASSKTPSRRTSARRAPAVPVEQTHPTRDRYAEIQTALANAGYYSGPQDGNWGDDSTKALQQFQQDQGLEPTGKIDSLTLIRLDLGPHYENSGTASEVTSKPAG